MNLILKNTYNKINKLIMMIKMHKAIKIKVI